ncbi:uncharacterized protein CCOS01_05095 [Colletotrichum costaricense]|uniref:Uncharacterized protein n=1 Tax=Colletotrichum costaricense TaxID=1209916 RepID=A0AAI9Z5B4_9PEZI|nr:uncharacterized protein CCOS01_05095 [Colletotrichum costaricense]KAK1533112.1 hypothetical protein CCOS01_05095 [Colletotrichum costaricense]
MRCARAIAMTMLWNLSRFRLPEAKGSQGKRSVQNVADLEQKPSPVKPGPSFKTIVHYGYILRTDKANSNTESGRAAVKPGPAQGRNSQARPSTLQALLAQSTPAPTSVVPSPPSMHLLTGKEAPRSCPAFALPCSALRINVPFYPYTTEGRV